MARAAAVIAIVIILGAPYRAVVSAQTAPPAAPPSAPATAADVAALRQSLEQLRAELAALNRRITVIEQEINTIQSR
ncbi:MAG TPA: hypothetical protein VKW09_02415 [bacterium]|nr:hypothetical protein [bacterium]